MGYWWQKAVIDNPQCLHIHHLSSLKMILNTLLTSWNAWRADVRELAAVLHINEFGVNENLAEESLTIRRDPFY